MSSVPSFSIWQAFQNGYQFVLCNFGIVCRISALASITLGIVIFIGVWNAHGSLDDILMPPFPELLGSALALLMTGHIAVGIHRAILLNERKPNVLRFGFPEAIYITVLAGLFVIHSTLGSLDFPIFGLVEFFIFVAYAINIWVMAYLPAIAISDKRASLKSVWRILSGYRLKFIGLVIIMWALVAVYMNIGAKIVVLAQHGLDSLFSLSHLSPYLEVVLAAAAMSLICIVGIVFIIATSASVLSEAYRFIAERSLLLENVNGN